MEWRRPAGTPPSSRRYVMEGSLGFSRSCSTMSSMLFSWQKMRTRCCATTASGPPSEPPPPPRPQSNSSWGQTEAPRGVSPGSGRRRGDGRRYLFERGQLGRVLNVSQAGALGRQLLRDPLELRMLRRQDQAGVVAQLPQVLQGLGGGGTGMGQSVQASGLGRAGDRHTWKTCPVALSLGFSSSSSSAVEMLSSTLALARDFAKSSYSWTCGRPRQSRSLIRLP